MPTRREFLRTGSLGAVGSMAAAAPVAVPSPTAPNRLPPVIKPPVLRAGDLVGLFAPAGGVSEPDSVRQAEELLVALGFRVRRAAHLMDGYGYLSAPDEVRAAELNAFAADDDVRALVAIRGGYGTMRLLPLVDFEAFRRHPKVVLGYSDLTSLLNAITLKTGLVTFHGPVATSSFAPYTLDYFRRTLMTTEPVGVLQNPGKAPDDLIQRTNRLWRLGPGRATGRLFGGNLSLVAATVGTPYDVPTAGSLLFLEETHEAPYRLDRMLTQLWLAGKLDELAGFVFGKCESCEDTDPGATLPFETILRTRIEPLRKPAVAGMMVGHVREQWTMPIGLPATLDADAGTLTLAESAVR